MAQRFSPNTIRKRLGLQSDKKPEDSEKNDTAMEIDTLPIDPKFCSGEQCQGCSGYSKGEQGKCVVCRCDFIDHPVFSDEEVHFEDEEYVSEYGGSEDW